MATPPGFTLNLTHEQQQMKNDCWATCLAMICRWRGEAFSREHIMNCAPFILQGYSHGDMATCPEAGKVIKTMSSGAITFEQLGTRKLDLVDFMRYINKRRVVMLSMQNHMWLVTGYDSNRYLLVHNVGRKDGPEIASPSFVKREMVDTMVLI